jgi:hypothetical protein
LIKKLFAFSIVILFIGTSIVSSTDNIIEDVTVNYQPIEPVYNPKVLSACDHLAYIGSSGELCSLYEFTLNDPGNLTCIWPMGGSGYFMSGTTWSNDGRWIACEYNSGTLWVIDPETGDMYQIGGGGTSCNSLAWDPVYNRLYGASSTSLFEYDPETGEQEFIGSFGLSGKTIIAIAINSEGECYAWDVLFSGDSTLFTVDLESGQAYEVGSLGMNLLYAQDGDFCKEDDTLYLATYTTNPYSGSYLYECDEDTASCTLIGQFQGDVVVSMFVIPWNFRPYTPSDPIPPSGTTGFPIDNNLSWTGGDPDGDYVVYDVYFGNSSPPPKVASYQHNTTYDPGILEYCTTYYWQIVTWDWYDAYREGPIWNFTTNCKPETPIINGSTNGHQGEEYNYSIVSTDLDGHDLYYLIDWGDGIEDVTGTYPSGIEIYFLHSWAKQGIYTIRAKAVDILGAESDWGELTVTMPRNKLFHNSLFLKFLDMYPLIQDLLDVLGRNNKWRKEVF